MPKKPKDTYRRIPFSALIHPIVLQKTKEFAAESHQSVNDILHTLLMEFCGLSDDDINVTVDPIIHHKHSMIASRPLREFKADLADEQEPDIRVLRPQSKKPPQIDGLDMDDYVAKIRSQVKANGGQTSE